MSGRRGILKAHGCSNTPFATSSMSVLTQLPVIILVFILLDYCLR